ncbi:MAG: peptidylprolyl isomerase, partial [Promethearchaeia archaeon]
VVPKGWVQMGSSLAGGDVSVFGGTFEDESFAVKHTGAGDVGMASAGVHANASQFYISLDKLDWLDGKKVVIGHVSAHSQAGKAI